MPVNYFLLNTQLLIQICFLHTSFVTGKLTQASVVGWKIIIIDNVYKFVFILFIPLLKR